MHSMADKLISVILIVCTVVQGWSYDRTISSQAQFDEAISRVAKGDTVSIKLHAGTYTLLKPITATAPLSIEGENVTITSYIDVYGKDDAVAETPTHYVCPIKKELGEYALMVDETGEIVRVSETVDDNTLVNTTDCIEGDNDGKVGGEVLIHIPPNLDSLKNRTFESAFGYFDCGWSNVKIRLRYSDDKYLYCTTLHTTNVPRFDYEKAVYRNEIRFVIYNAGIKAGYVYYDKKNIFIPKNVSRLYIKEQNVFNDAPSFITINSDVELSGITFDGIDGITVNSQTKAKCLITDCKFRLTGRNTLTITKRSEKDFIPVAISDCVFERCALSRGEILNLKSTYFGEPSFYVTRCTFERYPDAIVHYKNTSAMVNVNADALISDCVFCNTCRCHLYFTYGNSVSIGNIIYNTPEFNTARDRNLSNDWGLIYVNHVYKDKEKAIDNNTHKVVIEDCFLYGAYSHANDARGVMIDNGRGDVICRNNVVVDCQSYSLDARDAKKFVSTSSIRNIFEGNILGCHYRLEGGVDVPESDCPVSKENVLFDEYDNTLNSKTRIENGDIVLNTEAELVNNKVYVNKNAFNYLKRKTLYKDVRKFFGYR